METEFGNYIESLLVKITKIFLLEFLAKTKSYSIILKELKGFYKKADEIRDLLEKWLEEDDWSDHFEKIKDVKKNELIPVEIKELISRYINFTKTLNNIS